jgi:hypothetical protein
MQDEFRNTTNPRDPDCYGAPRPAHPRVPPANAADDIAFAILKLMQTKPRRRLYLTINHHFSDENVQGFFAHSPRSFWLPWFFDGHQMQRGALEYIENAFEGFVENLEWENE